MIINSNVSVNELITQAKNFPWKKPLCPNCNSHLWWHGFVLAFFSIFSQGVYIRRARCPCCGQVHRLKPKGFWKNFNHSASEIKQAIHSFVKHRRYPDNMIKRGTISKWIYRLDKMIRGVISISFSGSLLEGFEQLLAQGFIPVSRAKNYDNRTTS